jgi:hypothetical protein
MPGKAQAFCLFNPGVADVQGEAVSFHESRCGRCSGLLEWHRVLNGLRFDGRRRLPCKLQSKEQT